MPLDLDRLEQRVIGVLVEKQFTVPDTYPLTVNALVAGCNQKSNRDPAMSVEPYEVEGALRALMDRGWAQRMEKAGGRTPRYEHLAREQLAVDDADLAILTELLIRGPQAPGALKARVARMHAAGSPAEIEDRLRALAALPVPFVRELARRPREHANRWQHCLGPVDSAEAEESLSNRTEPVQSPPLSAPTGTTSALRTGSRPGRDSLSGGDCTGSVRTDSDDVGGSADARIKALERRVEELENRLDRLGV